MPVYDERIQSNTWQQHEQGNTVYLPEAVPAMNPPASRAARIESDQNLPATAGVVIIGGGILGVCAAYFLAKRGIAVSLCEKGVVAGEASSRAHGQVASAGFGPEKMELLGESKRIWGELSKTIGNDMGYLKNGYIAPCYGNEELEFWASWFETIKQYEPEASMLSAEEAECVLGSERSLTGAYSNPSDGCAEPAVSTSVFATAARKLGVKVFENCAVRGLGYKAGRVCEVITERGAIQTDTVVLAGGSWSMLFARSIGIDLPILDVYAACQSIAPITGGPEGTGDLPDVSWRRELDGGYSLSVIGVTVPMVPAMLRIGPKFIPAVKELAHHWELKYSLGRQFFTELFTPATWKLDAVSPFEQNRIQNPEVENYFLQSARERVVNYFPMFQGMKVREEWGGTIVTTPDNMPTISPVQSIPGLHLLTGFNYGFTMGPGAGKLMADIISGDKTSVDPEPYRYERHIDSSKLTVIA